MKKIKALVLMSGGLDSMLAAKILMEQNIDVTAVVFESSFYNSKKAEEATIKLNIPIQVIDIRNEMLKLVKNPPSGYGKNINPCIDCHALMIKKASEIAKKEKFDFIATGEVLGQRPFSQNSQALNRVSKLSKTEILRPLSAKLLPETNIEKQKLINRNKLLDIQGRSREVQRKLAENYKIKNYPSPAGGCILTDPQFSKCLFLMMEKWPDCDSDDTELLKYGRMFWARTKNNKNVLIIIGRNEEENKNLKKLAKTNDTVLELKEIKGPLSVVRFRISDFGLIDKALKIKIPIELNINSLKLDEKKDTDEILKTAGILTGYYSTKARGKEVKLQITKK